jgi:hypothetical protein
MLPVSHLRSSLASRLDSIKVTRERSASGWVGGVTIALQKTNRDGLSLISQPPHRTSMLRVGYWVAGSAETRESSGLGKAPLSVTKKEPVRFTKTSQYQHGLLKEKRLQCAMPPLIVPGEEKKTSCTTSNPHSRTTYFWHLQPVQVDCSK